MPAEVRSQSDTEYKGHVSFPRQSVDIFQRQHDIIFLKAHGVLPDGIEVLQIRFCSLKLYNCKG